MPTTTYIWNAPLGSEVNINIIDEWESQSASAVDFAFSCPNVWVEPTASAVDLDLDEEWSTVAGSADFDFYCGEPPVGDTIFDGFIVVYDGGSGDFDLTTAPIIYVDGIETGESGDFDLSTYPFAELEPVSYTGESADFDLENNQTLALDVQDGPTADFDLDDHPAAELDLTAPTGEDATIDLQTSITFIVDSVTGESGDFDLTDDPNPGMDFASAETGETGEIDLQSNAQATVLTFTGESGSITELDEDPNYEGADGSEISVDLSTTVTFTVDSNAGESGDFDLTDYPQWQPEFDVTVGEYGSLDFIQTVVLAPRATTGETSTVDLTTFAPPNMTLDVTVGESGSIALQVSQALGLFSVQAGANISIPELDTDPNWETFTGETVEFSIATATAFDLSVSSGEAAESTIDDHPSEGIGSLTVIEGTVSEFVLATLRSAILYPYPINAGTGVSFGFEDQDTFFGDIDLNYTACCPPAAVNTDVSQIELHDSPSPAIRYDGEKSPVATFELTTAPRLVFEVFTGEHMRTAPVNVFEGGFSVYDGATITAKSTGEVGVRLCVGNFVPDGANLLFEMATPYNDACESYLAHDGAAVSMVIEAYHNPEPLAETGETASCILTTETALLFQAYAGANARVRNLEFNIQPRTGESVEFEFYAEPITAAEGTTAVIGELKVEYEVAFGEMGCLDNEFVPGDENGDPDVDAIRTVPVEMDEFVHSIKGRCF